MVQAGYSSLCRLSSWGRSIRGKYSYYRQKVVQGQKRVETRALVLESAIYCLDNNKTKARTDAKKNSWHSLKRALWQSIEALVPRVLLWHYVIAVRGRTGWHR